jgi:hypothetical protein
MGRTIRVLCATLCVFAAVLSVSAVSASALTRGGAEEWSISWAYQDYGGGAWEINYCTGPYENVRGHTQWACYGHDINGGCREWQINVGPYGEQTYHTGLYCKT